MAKNNKIDTNIVSEVEKNFDEISKARECAESAAEKDYKEYRELFQE